MMPGDVITTLDDRDVSKLTPWGVLTIIGRKPVGSSVKVGFTRGGKALHAETGVGPPWGEP